MTIGEKVVEMQDEWQDRLKKSETFCRRFSLQESRKGDISQPEKYIHGLAAGGNADIREYRRGY